MRTIFLSRRWLVRLSMLAVLVILGGTVQFLGQNEQVASWVAAGLAGAPVFSSGEAANNAVSWLVEVEPDADGETLREMLTVLADNNARASFFISRDFAEGQPDLLLSIQAGGHQLGVLGGMTDGGDLDLATAQAEIADCTAALEEATGETPLLYLPEGGLVSDDVKRAAADAGLIVVLGGVDSGDWAAENAEEVIATVLQQAEAGSFITICPRDVTVAALNVILPEFAAKGLASRTVAENLTKSN